MKICTVSLCKSYVFNYKYFKQTDFLENAGTCCMFNSSSWGEVSVQL